MSRDKFQFLQFTVALVAEFASRFNISQKQALNYLVCYKGIEHLQNCYNVLHTFSFDDCVDALAVVCRNNGGRL